MATSKRIVLVDPLGEVLFSGESMIAREAAALEPCPETKRSAPEQSGIYRAVDPSEHAGAGEAAASEDSDSEIATKKRPIRAA